MYTTLKTPEDIHSYKTLHEHDYNIHKTRYTIFRKFYKNKIIKEITKFLTSCGMSRDVIPYNVLITFYSIFESLLNEPVETLDNRIVMADNTIYEVEGMRIDRRNDLLHIVFELFIARVDIVVDTKEKIITHRVTQYQFDDGSRKELLPYQTHNGTNLIIEDSSIVQLHVSYLIAKMYILYVIKNTVLREGEDISVFEIFI